jgi:hypothetical protein
MLDALFGRDRDRLWQQVALEIGATYNPDFWGDGKVLLQHRHATIVLDIYHYGKGSKATRMRASFASRDGFWFTIYPRGMISSVRKWLGMQDVEVGHARFDEDYIIQGNDEAKVRELFANSQIRFLIESLPAIHFSIADHDHSFWGLPAGIDELCLTTNDDMRELNGLKLLFELFAETLDELERLGTLPPLAERP